MFALIIAIIAIALTVYLAVSTLFYGGDALSNGSARAIASSFINQGQQINGAHTLYKNDNAGMSITEATVGGLNVLSTAPNQYLSSTPVPQAGSVWTIDDDYDADGAATVYSPLKVVKSTSSGATGPTVIADEVCKLIQDKASAGSATFGCAGSTTLADTTDNVVWYRL